MESRVAVIDLGSNSVRMTINLLKDDGSWECVLKRRATVRLSEGMGEDRVLKENAMSRVVDALKEFCSTAKLDSCRTIVAIATEAVRSAVNRKSFIERIFRETGIRFDVISGADEAYYGYLAVRESLPVKDGLIIDTGGGSSELILVKGGQMQKNVSLPLGAVVLSENKHIKSQSELYRCAAMTIGTVDWIDEAQSFDIYALGGSAKTLASLAVKDMKKAEAFHGMSLSYSKVAGIYQKIYNTPLSLRANIPGMDKSRADIILAGLTPLKALMDMLGSKKAVVSAYGVKEGVFFRVRDEIIKNEWGRNK